MVELLIMIICVLVVPPIIVLVPVAVAEWTMHNIEKEYKRDVEKEVYKDSTWYFIDEDDK